MMSVFTPDQSNHFIPPHAIAFASTFSLGLVTSTALFALGCSTPSFASLATASLSAAALGRVFEHCFNARLLS